MPLRRGQRLARRLARRAARRRTPASAARSRARRPSRGSRRRRARRRPASATPGPTISSPGVDRRPGAVAGAEGDEVGVERKPEQLPDVERVALREHDAARAAGPRRGSRGWRSGRRRAPAKPARTACSRAAAPSSGGGEPGNRAAASAAWAPDQGSALNPPVAVASPGRRRDMFVGSPTASSGRAARRRAPRQEAQALAEGSTETVFAVDQRGAAPVQCGQRREMPLAVRDEDTWPAAAIASSNGASSSLAQLLREALPQRALGPGRRSRTCAGARRRRRSSVGIERAVTGPSGVTAHASSAPRTSRCSISTEPSGSAARTSSAPSVATGGATASSQRGFSAAQLGLERRERGLGGGELRGRWPPAGGLPREDLDAARQLPPLAQTGRLPGEAGASAALPAMCASSPRARPRSASASAAAAGSGRPPASAARAASP